MCCYAEKLLQQSEMNNPTILVVTDRNDLDGQLFNTFSNARELLRQTPVQAGSREELRGMLGARQAGGIIFTTVQKFSLLNGEEVHPSLSRHGNIVVIPGKAMIVCMSREICVHLYNAITALRQAEKLSYAGSA